MKKIHIFLISLLFIIIDLTSCNQDVIKVPLKMPNVRPKIADLYLCSPFKIENDHDYNIVGFEPNATMDVVHHIILYGCSKPGLNLDVWGCGEMSSSEDDTMKSAAPCKEDSEIIYAWARDAPALKLPEGVGFRIGKYSNLKYLVLQVHYLHIDKFKDGTTDTSGIVLNIVKKSLNKQAGVYVMLTSGSIRPHGIEYMETSCVMTENKTLHPFAYRTHTHALGRVVSGYVIKNNDNWIELGKRDPLTPQMFYDVDYKGTINKNDRLAARCTMESDRDTWTMIGNTHNDEMCNFYLMYYVENDKPLKDSYCATPGPPYYSWKKDGLMKIPDIEASSL